MVQHIISICSGRAPPDLALLLLLQVGNDAAVLGFVGAPFTLATYIVEGGSSKNFAAIKRMAFAESAVLHALLDKLADNVADYVRYQVGVHATLLLFLLSSRSFSRPFSMRLLVGPKSAWACSGRLQKGCATAGGSLGGRWSHGLHV